MPTGPQGWNQSLSGTTLFQVRPEISQQRFTQNVQIAGQRTLYLSVHDDEQPAEIFLRLKGPDCSAELIGLYDVVALPLSLAMQHGGGGLRRWRISSLEPSLFHVVPSSGTIASGLVPVCRISSFGTC